MNTRLTVRITDDMKHKIQETGYSASEYVRLAIEKQLSELPPELITKEQILLHDKEFYQNEIEMSKTKMENMIKLYQKEIHSLENKLQETETELQNVQENIAQCNSVSHKIQQKQSQNKEEIMEVILTVKQMIEVHNDKQKYSEFKTKPTIEKCSMNFFAKKTGLRTDELMELFEKYNFDIRII